VLFDKFAITHAEFTPDGNRVLLASNNRPHLYTYDLHTGTTTLRQLNIAGMGQSRFPHFAQNTTTHQLVLIGKRNEGTVHLCDARTFEWTNTMKAYGAGGHVVSVHFSLTHAERMFTMNGE
jgi:hypothetical protein